MNSVAPLQDPGEAGVDYDPDDLDAIPPLFVRDVEFERRRIRGQVYRVHALALRAAGKKDAEIAALYGVKLWRIRDLIRWGDWRALP